MSHKDLRINVKATIPVGTVKNGAITSGYRTEQGITANLRVPNETIRSDVTDAHLVVNVDNVLLRRNDQVGPHLFQYLEDGYSLSDLQVVGFNKKVSHINNFSDLLQVAVSKPFKELLGLSDVIRIVRGKVVKEKLILDDHVLKGYSKLKADVVSLKDDVDTLFAKKLTSRFRFSDVVAVSSEKTAKADTVGWKDVVIISQGRLYKDEMGLLDTKPIIVFNKATTDVLGLTDSVSNAFGKPVSTMLGLLDVIKITRTYMRYLADEVNLYDTLRVTFLKKLNVTLGLREVVMMGYRKTGKSHLGLFVKQFNALNKAKRDSVGLKTAVAMSTNKPAWNVIGFDDTVIIDLEFKRKLANKNGWTNDIEITLQNYAEFGYFAQDYAGTQVKGID